MLSVVQIRLPEQNGGRRFVVAAEFQQVAPLLAAAPSDPFTSLGAELVLPGRSSLNGSIEEFPLLRPADSP